MTEPLASRSALTRAYVWSIDRVGGVRTNLRRLLRPLRLRREIQRGRLVLPTFADAVASMPKSRRNLSAQYAAYTSTVSVPSHAISLQTASLLDALCETLRPREVLDLGSGFTSYVLREYQRRSSERVRVKSIDDDGAWLQRTREFLEARGTSTDDMGTLESWIEGDERSYDLVCYDLGRFDVRARHLSRAIASCRPSTGIVLVDDLHHPPYRAIVRDVLARTQCHVIEIEHTTRDQFGRYAMLVTGIVPSRSAEG